MLHVAVLDTSAQSRQSLVSRFQRFIDLATDEYPLLPRVSLRAISPHELKFHAAPDVCIIGSELLTADLLEISRVRALLPDTAILAALSQDLKSLAIIEQVVRLGSDDVLLDTVEADEFARKLIIFAKRSKPKAGGMLVVVDGAKGGVGVTSVTAALAETLLDQGKSVAVVDGDFESQDLSRFIQARPFINEPLRLLLDEQRPVSVEFVEQCLVPVWENCPGLRAMPPPPESDDLWAPTPRQARILASIFEVLDTRFDVVLVDSGSMRAAFREVLYRIADKVLCVVSNDPASLFASIDRIERIRRSVASGVEVSLVENSSFPGGVSNQLLKEEFSRAVRIDAHQWLGTAIPFCRRAARWPASGGTLLSQGSAKSARAIRALATGLLPQHCAESLGESTFSGIASRLRFWAPRSVEAEGTEVRRIKSSPALARIGVASEAAGEGKPLLALEQLPTVEPEKASLEEQKQQYNDRQGHNEKIEKTAPSILASTLIANSPTPDKKRSSSPESAQALTSEIKLEDMISRVRLAS